MKPWMASPNGRSEGSVDHRTGCVDRTEAWPPLMQERGQGYAAEESDNVSPSRPEHALILEADPLLYGCPATRFPSGAFLRPSRRNSQIVARGRNSSRAPGTAQGSIG